MNDVHSVLRKLREWFFVWFTVEAVAGTATAAYVLNGIGRHSPLRHAMVGLGTTGTILAGIGVSLVLLILACVVLEAMLDLRPWARTTMLIIGWITVVSGALNLLALPVSAALLPPLARFTGGDWLVLLEVSVLTKFADLAFWSWVIFVLQMNQAVRVAFLHRSTASS